MCSLKFHSRLYNLFMSLTIRVSPFPKRQIKFHTLLDSEFAHSNFELDENGTKFSKRVDNCVEKREIACYEQFLLFPQCFLKTCTTDMYCRACLGKGKCAKRHSPEKPMSGFGSKWGVQSYNAISVILQCSQTGCKKYLTHFHTMTPYDAPGKQAFWKHCGKRRNCL